MTVVDDDETVGCAKFPRHEREPSVGDCDRAVQRLDDHYRSLPASPSRALRPAEKHQASLQLPAFERTFITTCGARDDTAMRDCASPLDSATGIPEPRRTFSTTATPFRRSASAPTPARARTAPRPSCSALEVGYRLIETAVNYENEAEVGEQYALGPPATRCSSPARSRAAITPSNDAIASVHGSLERLALDRLDLQPHPLAEPEPRSPTSGLARRSCGTSRTGGAVHRRLELHRGAHRRGSSGHRSHTRRQPGGAASRFPRARMREVHGRLGIGPRPGARWASGGRHWRRWPSTAAVDHDVPPVESSSGGTCRSARWPIPQVGGPHRQCENLDSSGSSSRRTRWTRTGAGRG